MAVVTTNLGTVTAYGDAVAAGYTGTKEEWQALMADYAENVPKIEQNTADIADLKGAIDGSVEDYINDWLDSHPEATTTVQDGSITSSKLASESVSTTKMQDGAITYAKIDDALKNRIDLYESPHAYLKYTEAWITDSSNVEYGQQGMCVTDNYIVLAGSSISPLNTKNYIYVLNKETYEPITLNQGNPFFIEFDSSTTPTTSHAGCLAWDKDNGEIYLQTFIDNIAIVFDDTTLSEKRRETMPDGGWIGYDNVTKHWCFVSYTNNGTQYLVKIYDTTKTTLLKTFTVDREININEGVYFNDGLIYIHMSASDDASGGLNIYKRPQGILVIDTDGHVIKFWWFNNIYEIEGLSVLRDGVMLVASSDLGYIRLLEMPYKPTATLIGAVYEHMPTRVNVTSNYVNGTFYFLRNGNTVQVYANTLKNLPADTKTQIATVPEFFRPIENIEFDCPVVATTLGIIRIYITAEGVMSAYNYTTNTGNTNTRVFKTYIAR